MIFPAATHRSTVRISTRHSCATSHLVKSFSPQGSLACCPTAWPFPLRPTPRWIGRPTSVGRARKWAAAGSICSRRASANQIRTARRCGVLIDFGTGRVERMDSAAWLMRCRTLMTRYETARHGTSCGARRYRPAGTATEAQPRRSRPAPPRSALTSPSTTCSSRGRARSVRRRRRTRQP